MVVRGSLFDSTTLAVVLSAAAELQELGAGMMVQGFSIKNGLDGHVYVLTGLISLYAKCGEMVPAKLLFEQIEQPDLVSYNAMISGFSSNCDIASAVSLFGGLLLSGEKFPMLVKSSHGYIPSRGDLQCNWS
ncbi:hypothetical protein ACET3Z_020307 [Daucus carota]